MMRELAENRFIDILKDYKELGSCSLFFLKKKQNIFYCKQMRKSGRAPSLRSMGEFLQTELLLLSSVEIVALLCEGGHISTRSVTH